MLSPHRNNNLLPSDLALAFGQKLVVELDEQNEEVISGGCFTCEDTLRARVTARDSAKVELGISQISVIARD